MDAIATPGDNGSDGSVYIHICSRGGRLRRVPEKTANSSEVDGGEMPQRERERQRDGANNVDIN